MSQTYAQHQTGSGLFPYSQEFPAPVKRGPKDYFFYAITLEATVYNLNLLNYIVIIVVPIHVMCQNITMKGIANIIKKSKQQLKGLERALWFTFNLQHALPTPLPTSYFQLSLLLSLIYNRIITYVKFSKSTYLIVEVKHCFKSRG